MARVPSPRERAAKSGPARGGDRRPVGRPLDGRRARVGWRGRIAVRLGWIAGLRVLKRVAAHLRGGSGGFGEQLVGSGRASDQPQDGGAPLRRELAIQEGCEGFGVENFVRQ
jgi:hypothetical protein